MLSSATCFEMTSAFSSAKRSTRALGDSPCFWVSLISGGKLTKGMWSRVRHCFLALDDDASTSLSIEPVIQRYCVYCTGDAQPVNGLLMLVLFSKNALMC